MSYEYKIEHYGACEVNLNRLCQLLGEESLQNRNYSVSVESINLVYFASARTDAARLAFAKTIEYLLSISDSVVVSEV